MQNRRYKTKQFKCLERALLERVEKSLFYAIERMKTDKPDSFALVYTVGNSIAFLSDPGLSNSSAIGMLERAKFDLLMKVDC
jgi:hypothetical protein